MRQALGKGLDALIRRTSERTDIRESGTVQKIPVHKVKPNRYQPRTVFNDESLQELAQSIKQHGLAQPITVIYDSRTDTYELITGERRLRASQLAGLSEINAIIQTKLDEEQMLAHSLIENIQREDLNPIDTAIAFRQLIDSFSIAQSELARYCGKSKSAVSNSLRLLELEAGIQKAVQSLLITEGHARALLTVPDREKRRRLFEIAVEKKMTVRQLEDAARTLSDNGTGRAPSRRTTKKPPEIAELETLLQRSLGTKVEIRQSANHGGGALIIRYNSFGELDRISFKLRQGQ